MDTISSTRIDPEATRGPLTLDLEVLEKAISKQEDADVAVTIQESPDENVVDWNGLDDHEMPLNWPASKKRINMAWFTANSFLTWVNNPYFYKDGC